MYMSIPWNIMLLFEYFLYMLCVAKVYKNEQKQVYDYSLYIDV